MVENSHHSAKTKRKISSGNKGKQLSKETKRKMSEAHKGKVSPNIDMNKCKDCGKSTKTKNAIRCEKCYWKFNKGKEHNNYKGFIRIDGYVYILKPSHPRAMRNGYVSRSYLVMENHINRFIKKGEIVHHINKTRDDDRIKNLRLFKNTNEHSSFHAKIRFPKGSMFGANAKPVSD